MTIEERVENMEMGLACAKRRNRLLLAGVLLSFVLLAAAMTAGIASREDIVNAKQFNLLDDNGKTRAVLVVDEDGPLLSLNDENGKPHAILNANKDGSALDLFDKNGKLRVILAVDVNGSTLFLADENKKLRASLAEDVDGPRLCLRDENGKLRVALTATVDGPMLDLSDKNGNTRARLGINKTTTPGGKVITYPESSLLLFDANDKVIWEAPR
jgi:hypothetical protein